MFRTHIPGVVAALCFMALTGCASASAPLEDLRAPAGEQVLRPGDIVQTVVWREEDLTGESMVDRSGHVVLPRVGRWDVSGETESSLEQRLTEAFGEDLRTSAVDVIVLRRIQVLGAVEEPGLYKLDNTMTLGDALATAGGVDPTGRRDRIDIIRGSERFVIELDKDLGLAELGLRSGDSVYVPQRNWFVRNYPALLSGLSSLSGIVALIISINNN